MVVYFCYHLSYKIMLTCQILMSSCQIFILICQIFMLTFRLQIVCINTIVYNVKTNTSNMYFHDKQALQWFPYIKGLRVFNLPEIFMNQQTYLALYPYLTFQLPASSVHRQCRKSAVVYLYGKRSYFFVRKARGTPKS